MACILNKAIIGMLMCAVLTSVAFASPIKTIDLASDTAWTLSIDGRRSRAIKVPGGGWNSDFQSPRIPTMTGVKDHVIYQRKITVPKVTEGQVTKILFGAVNYGAEVYVDGKPVATIVKPYVPFDVDVTTFVKPGQEHVLTVKAYHRRHYHGAEGKGKSATVPVGFDFPVGSKSWFSWAGNTKFAYGITTSIRLAVYPPVYIRDVFIKPSVSKDSLTAVVWIRNSTDKKVSLAATGKLLSWNKDRWKYPEVPASKIVIDPGQTKELVLGPVKWGLGEESYWWPNIPFNEKYKAKLHYLDIALAAEGKVVHRRRQRFGFVEHREGKFYYTVNGVRITSISDSNSYGQVGEFDCWSNTPCFLPPNGKFKGCPEWH